MAGASGNASRSGILEHRTASAEGAHATEKAQGVRLCALLERLVRENDRLLTLLIVKSVVENRTAAIAGEAAVSRPEDDGSTDEGGTD